MREGVAYFPMECHNLRDSHRAPSGYNETGNFIADKCRPCAYSNFYWDICGLVNWELLKNAACYSRLSTFFFFFLREIVWTQYVITS